ncbi:hypothetical protein SUGI_0543530 [Cryptomeria japonica]|nr:hypothetical protein SUGI_0543530 [Cryptomeria japonica]
MAAPMATINPTGLIAVVKAITPIVDMFSSPSPSGLYPGILKTDLIALGVNILATWKEGRPRVSSSLQRLRYRHFGLL